MKKAIYIASIIVAAASALTACAGNSTDKAREAAALEAVEEAKGEPIVLAKGDTLQFGQSQPIPVVVDFTATWCGPCRMFSPIFHKAAKTYQGRIKFISVDIDQCPDIAAEYGVSAVPTILFVSKTGDMSRAVGAMSETEFITALDMLLQGN